MLENFLWMLHRIYNYGSLTKLRDVHLPEETSHIINQKSLCCVWILKFQYHVHKNPSLDLVLIQMSLAHIVKPISVNTHFNIILPYMPRIVGHDLFFF